MAKNKRKLFLVLITLVFVFNFAFSSNFVLAAAGDVEFLNPLTAGDMPALLNNILSVLQGVVVLLAVLMIVIGGIMYMASFGNDKAMTRAKSVVAAAVIGLAIVLAARTFLQEIWNILGVGSTVTSPGGDSFLNIATRALNLLLSIVGVIAIIGMVVGGIMYLTSYGDDDRIKTGKKILTASLIGLVICLASVVAVQQIINLIS